MTGRTCFFAIALCLTAVYAGGTATPSNQHLRKLSSREETVDRSRNSNKRNLRQAPRVLVLDPIHEPSDGTRTNSGNEYPENDATKEDDSIGIGGILANPGAALDHVVRATESMGSMGMAYFGLIYLLLDLLAIPAVAFTVSAGYLFGPIRGTAIVLSVTALAAGLSFFVGRFLLRGCVEQALRGYPRFARLDRAIGREGFKLTLLVRLSPVFPFAVCNYLFGASSVNFLAFFGGTMLGFAPGAFAIVYSGYVGKALTGASGDGVYPWYVYLGGLVVWLVLLRLIARNATKALEEMEDTESKKVDGEPEDSWRSDTKEDIEDTRAELVVL